MTASQITSPTHTEHGNSSSRQHVASARIPKHLQSLDALRGLAALSVVCCHYWQHFLAGDAVDGRFDIQRLPFSGLLSFFYSNGWRAVDLFFCLSGFIFFWLYSDKIGNRQVSLREFFILRFSRLYPLHLFTLLFVAGAQQVVLSRLGHYFVYPNNDIYHFASQLAFASCWGGQAGLSFNGPVWSVSVEVLLYAGFFVVCLLGYFRPWHLVFYVCAGYVLAVKGHSPVGQGMLSFFMGGLAFQFFKQLLNRNSSRAILIGLLLATVLLWWAIPWSERHESLHDLYEKSAWAGRLSLRGKDVIGGLLHDTTSLFYRLLLFPLTIITLAFWETNGGTLGRRFAFLGNISYSSYLLHFPLQLVFVLMTSIFAAKAAVFYSPWLFLTFFAILIALSWSSYHFVERPCQSLIRNRLLSPPGRGKKLQTS